MGKTATPTLQGDVLTLQPGRDDGECRPPGVRTFVLEVASEAASNTLLASLPILDRLLSEKITSVRKQRMEEMVDFLAAHMVAPTQSETEMAQRLASRHARVLNEFGYFTAERLADMNHSRAHNRSALTDNWRKRNQVFAVPHPNKMLHEQDVFPAFQFEDGKPIKAVHAVLEAFGGRKTPWKLALWFTSNNGWLPGSARPVDLLTQNPQAVIEAAHREAEGSAA
ncbi:hypothetical protein H0484_04680 [Pusillimonas sp. CC-YST705]|uniref:DUF2384 domain-containing protein n=1 Tax=Mesopusillimonas faecipullorum TaxID=2755040 RepID=A0ABS8CB22_9BURK|nr:hypothetical protein [Mesopusillimonas faecipullorum]MCB5363049.1 hypothetical protein [Mesopusillimonas faecipullorum]